MASVQIGTLTRNTDPQEKCSSSSPPPSGPTTIPSPDTPAHTPMARARSRPVKTLVRIDSVVGKMKAPPIPISPRQTISIVADRAWDASAEQAPNTTSPKVSAPLRPSRSPSDPAVSSRPAKTMV